MTEKLDVIRRLKLGQSIRQINRETGVHRTIVRKLHTLAQSKEWLDKDQPLPSQRALAGVLEISQNNREVKPHPLSLFHDEIAGWLQNKYSYLVIYLLICKRYPCSEATVRRYCHKHFPHLIKPVTLRKTIPGEVMEVDFGYLGITYDPHTQRRRKTYLFSARLRHSRYAFRMKVFDQKQSTFFRGHSLAFEYFGGVPHKVVPDNLKAAVLKASFEDPLVNRAYHRLALHYGFLISPCLPKTPRHKGGVESDIKYVKKNFWPLYREREKQLGHEIPYAHELQAELERWSRQVAHVRSIQGVGRRPLDLFLQEEQQSLNPLPTDRWDQIDWAQHKVQETWRVQHDRAFYSVPYQFIGKSVVVYANSLTVEIYLGEKMIAMHKRAQRDWEYVQNPLHAPPNAQQYLGQSRESLLKWAGQCGEPVAQVAKAILSRKGVDGMRPARALLALSRKYGPSRLRAACRRALLYDTPEYVTVKRILLKNLDQTLLDSPLDSEANYCFTFARQAGFFLPENHIHKEAEPWTN